MSPTPNPNWKPGDPIQAPAGRMLDIDPASKSVAEIYKFMVTGIIPRPIAFVSTVDAAGVVNLAPFSFFNGISSNPPCLMISIARKPDGSKKDTLRNIEANRQFVVNSSNEWLAEAVIYCAATFPYGMSEMQKVGLSPLPSTKVRPPRVKESALQFECELHQAVPIGDGTAGSATAIIGKIVQIHVSESVMTGDRIDPAKMRPLARLGGPRYGLIGEMFELDIPELDQSENFVARPRRG